ncbi:unnamed protein product [Musa acuminata subsp. malaccensis]|uniref:(wild Malaysian banana) hypothetical protein n=1 Tax=Musa acuminata subsp. malaccensis TaxID=214687 RepID=A0A804IY84_MUSAM|nr:unnamed protein product [Musa acuminata subsp. malaccensis]
MAAPSTFQERLRQMEATRTQRLALLRAEKEIQIAKSHLLSEKIEELRRAERRCLLLERRNAEIAHRILTNRTQIDAVDARYQGAAREYRHALIFTPCLLIDSCTNCTFRWRGGFGEAEMEEFKERQRRFVSDTREEVRKLRDWVSELKSSLKRLQGNDGYLNTAKIAVAEARKSELLAEKEKLDKNLASSSHLRQLLQKQLHKMLISKDREKNSTTLLKDKAEK